MELPKFKLIYLSRTMCLGLCPVYKLKIYSDGRIEYTGEHYVKVTGKHTWTIDAKTLDKLNDAIVKWQYFEVQKKEGVFTFVTDMPYCITAVIMEDGRKRSIEHYLQDDDEWPSALRRFEKCVEKIVGVKKYIGDGEVCI